MNNVRFARFRAVLTIGAAVLVAVIAARQAQRALAADKPAWREELDVVYGKGGKQDLKLDLYMPLQPGEPTPAIVFIHGGGWREGSKSDLRSFCQAFAKMGYVAVTVDYRLAPANRWPAQIEDVKCAVRWLRANAKRLRVDPERIAAAGSSAGGHLALLLGFTQAKDGLEGTGGWPNQSSQVSAVVNIVGPTDLAERDWSEPVEQLLINFLGGSRTQIADVFRQASPLTYLRKDAPPVLTWHGTKDDLVPYSQATKLDAAMKQIGASSQLETIEGKGHGDDWTQADWTRVAIGSMAFLGEQFKKP
jgi:acetyl esterase/lipase